MPCGSSRLFFHSAAPLQWIAHRTFARCIPVMCGGNTNLVISLFFCFPFSLSLSYIDSSISFAILFHSLEVLIENVFSLIRGIIDISRERIDTSGEFCAAHHHYITRAYEQNLRTDSPSPAVTVEDARFWKWTLLPAANLHERWRRHERRFSTSQFVRILFKAGLPVSETQTRQLFTPKAPQCANRCERTIKKKEIFILLYHFLHIFCYAFIAYGSSLYIWFLKWWSHMHIKKRIRKTQTSILITISILTLKISNQHEKAP